MSSSVAPNPAPPQLHPWGCGGTVYHLSWIHTSYGLEAVCMYVCMYLPGSAPSRYSVGHCGTHSCSSPLHACDGQVFVTASWERNSHSGSMPRDGCVRQKSRREWRRQICSRTPRKLQPLSHDLAYTAVLNLPDPKLSCRLQHPPALPPLVPHQNLTVSWNQCW